MGDLPDTTVSAVNNVISLTGEPVHKPDIFKPTFKAEKPDTKVKAFFESLWQIRAARKIKDPRLKLANRITRKCPPLAAGLSNLAQAYCTHLIEKIVAQARTVNYGQHQACEASVSSLLHGKHLQVFLKGKVIAADNVLFGTLTARPTSLAGLIESIGQLRLIPAILKDFYHVNERYEHLYCQLHTMTAEERSALKTTLPKLERWRRDRLWAKLYATCTRENRQDFEVDIVTQRGAQAQITYFRLHPYGRFKYMDAMTVFAKVPEYMIAAKDLKAAIRLVKNLSALHRTMLPAYLLEHDIEQKAKQHKV